MTAYEAVLAERRRQRRIARRIEAVVVILILAAAAAVFFGYHPERASAAYNHVGVCESTLRGYYSDDDVHNWGVATARSRSAAGAAQGITRTAASSSGAASTSATARSWRTRAAAQAATTRPTGSWGSDDPSPREERP
jgi:hypothetical protein